MSPLLPAKLSATSERMFLDHGVIDEWYVNSPAGIRHGWTVPKSPPGAGDLRIGLEVGGGFTLRIDPDARGGVFVRAQGTEVPYRDLAVFDANGTLLPSWLEHGSDGVEIRVDDTDARYPLTVDPVLSGPDWFLHAEKANAEMGYSLSSAGDVNGDGFADFLVAAPFYDQGMLGAGKVWLYFGSATGPFNSTWNGVGFTFGAFYGRSVFAAGDVNGDGYGDVIIGSPGYSSDEFYQEGAAFLFHGSATGLGNWVWVETGGQESARYGGAVSTAGDVNGDGYSDVIVGAALYNAGEFSEGAAWLYHGSPSGIASANWSADSDRSPTTAPQ